MPFKEKMLKKLADVEDRLGSMTDTEVTDKTLTALLLVYSDLAAIKRLVKEL